LITSIGNIFSNPDEPNVSQSAKIFRTLIQIMRKVVVFYTHPAQSPTGKIERIWVL